MPDTAVFIRMIACQLVFCRLLVPSFSCSLVGNCGTTLAVAVLLNVRVKLGAASGRGAPSQDEELPHAWLNVSLVVPSCCI